MNLGNGKIKWVLLIGGILIFAVCAIVLTGGSLLRGNPTAPPISSGQPNNQVPPVAVDNSGSGVQLSQVVTARTVGNGNQPVDVTNQFSQNDGVIYAVAQGVDVPQGTRIFARWSRDGTPFEDTNEIVADRAYQGTYIEFHIQPTNTNLNPGTYTVQFYVNGNPGPQTLFTVS